eukprot:scaffold121_cov356-Pavlova_lutheri.AAC.29
MSPAAAAGSRFNLAPHPTTAITYKFLAPVLSAQFITAPTGNARDMRNLLPEAPPRPGHVRQLPSPSSSSFAPTSPSLTSLRHRADGGARSRSCFVCFPLPSGPAPKGRSRETQEKTRSEETESEDRSSGPGDGRPSQPAAPKAAARCDSWISRKTKREERKGAGEGKGADAGVGDRQGGKE